MKNICRLFNTILTKTCPRYGCYRRPLAVEMLEPRRLLAVFQVSNLLDAPVISAGDAPGTLRQAIFDANTTVGPDSIAFSSALHGVIELTQGELEISAELTIDGPGAQVITVSAAGNDPTPDVQDGLGSRIFSINDLDDATPRAVEINGLTLTGGDSGGNGGAILSSEDVTLRGVSFEHNDAQFDGGAVYTLIGTATIDASTFHHNRAGDDGGAAFILNGELILTQSTLSGNQAQQDGGGIFTLGGTVSINHSTITDNRADADSDDIGNGGGLFATPGTDVSLEHTLVAENWAVAPDLSGTADASFSLVGDTAGASLIGSDLVLDVNPLLGPLADNGGATLTHALLSNSPAIDAGDPASITAPMFDQRGSPFVREFDGNQDLIDVVDIGAYERQTVVGLNLVVGSADDTKDGDFSPGGLTLREAVGLANGSLNSTEAISFSAEMDGSTILLVRGEMRISDSVSIDARDLPNGLTIDASGNDPTPEVPDGAGSRVFNVSDPDESNVLEVTLSGVSLTGGDVNGNGGAISSGEPITLVESTIRDNHARFDGGGIFVLADTALVSNSTFSGNVADDDGGGLFALDTVVDIINSTLSGNAAGDDGGGLFLLGGATTAAHATFADNRADADDNGAGEGGGIFVGGSLSLSHTVVADNLGTGPDLFGAANASFSLIGDTSQATITGDNLLLNFDPLLLPLAANGGPTQSHLLTIGSPGIDAGNAQLSMPPEFDQRGEPFPRIADGDGDTVVRIDIGAVEFLPPPALLGDYNRDGLVGITDYPLWRDALGDTVAPFSAADGNGNGIVDQPDFDIWKANFGNVLTAGSDVTTDEPPTTVSRGPTLRIAHSSQIVTAYAGITEQANAHARVSQIETSQTQPENVSQSVRHRDLNIVARRSWRPQPRDSDMPEAAEMVRRDINDGQAIRHSTLPRSRAQDLAFAEWWRSPIN